MSASELRLPYRQGCPPGVFSVGPDGTFSYLSADGELGWRDLGFAAVVAGRQVRPRRRGARRAGEGAVILHLEYPGTGLAERVTLRVLSAPAALTVERVFVNAGGAEVRITEVMTIPPGEGAGVVFGEHGASDLRVVHVGNLRETVCRQGVPTPGTFVAPLPSAPRILGDSEGHPFPAMAICDANMRTFLLEASLQHDVFTQMWRVAGSAGPGGRGAPLADYAAIARDGRSQPVAIAPGQERRLSAVFYQVKTDCPIQDLYDDYLAELNRRYDLLGKRSPLLASAVYCTWNYTFFADISEEVIRRQCRFISERLKGIRYFLIDDGYQRSGNTPSYDFGRWYPDPDANVDPVRFPNGMKPVADLIRSCGLKPALWWAPALGRRNRLVAEHPEWLCLDDRGESWSMDSGPERKAALDFSLPAVREFVESALETIFVKWGFIGMKLDFCTYPFDCKDIRLAGGEGVRWWYWLMERIARYVPADGFFQVCGSGPYGNPFLARFCDSHRVGGDIGHGRWEQHRAVSRAPLPLLAVPGRSTMLMDVDSAGINLDLSDDENLSRLNWCFITQGVLGIGGDLTRLAERQVAWLERITRACDRGYKVRCPDERAFTGEPLPEALYVDYPPGSPTARSGVRKHVGLFNWDDQAKTVTCPPAELGIDRSDRVRDFWTGEDVSLGAGRLAAELRPRASRLLEVTGPR